MAVPLTLSSVPAQTPYVQYVATGSQTVFPYPFEITQDSDLVCLINGVAQATDAGYTLTGQGATGGGNLTFTVGQNAGTIITLYRNISIARITQLSTNGTFFSSNFNDEFNRIYLIMQQLQQSLLPGGNQAYALMVPNSNNPAPNTLLTPSAYANKYLSFDSFGNPQPALLTSSGSITTSLIAGLLYPQTTAEAAAGVAPTNLAVPSHTALGVVIPDRYGTNTTPGTTDMSAAVQAAVNVVGQLGGGTILFEATTYLVAGVTIAKSAAFRGQGFVTVLQDKTTLINGTNYSQSMFTATAAIDAITFKDLTLDGACNNANGGDASEIAMVKITNTSKVTFDAVKLTRYCGGWGGVTKAASASFWEAIVVQNATKTTFLNCLFADNHYEMVLVWNAPGSHNEVLVDGFLELNTGTPNAHSAFDINGGHVTVVNSVWNNTGLNSQLNIQVAESVRVANNAFLSMQAGAAAQCNIGQDVFPYNSDVLVENNYFLNANSAAIAVGSGSSIVIRGNVIDTPGNYGIKLTSGVTDFTTFNTEYPEWPAPSASGSSSIIITDNVINAVSNASSLSKGIYLHTVNRNVGYWFKDVQIRGNTVTAGAAPNNTFYGLVLDDCQDLIVRDNWLQYTQNGIFFESLVQNARIEGNTFSNVPPLAGNDIVWAGAYTSSNVKIRNNQFITPPVGVNYTVFLFAGSVTGLDVIDNQGIHPTLPVGGTGGLATTAYTAYQTKNVRVSAVPAAGDWSINDVVYSVPAAGATDKYVCTVAGSFGSALSCTATGTTPNTFFTCSAIGQLHVGQRLTVAGAGVAAANLNCVVTYITGSTFYVDQAISTSVTNASCTLLNPTFIDAAVTGYGTPTGGAYQSSFAAGSISLANLAAGVAQLIIDLKTRGVIAS